MAYTDIDRSSDYFNTKLYTGNGSTQSITGVGFQPDWLWIKSRSTTGNGRVHDVVRGVDKQLYTSLTNAEFTYSPNTGVTSFDSDGFSLGNDIGQNQSSVTFASWNWLASNTTASNTDGSITSTVSANTTSGFSIVSYTGTGSLATVGHGLGVTPKFMIIKNRDSGSENFCSYHVSLGATKTQKFTTSAAQTLSSMWNNTEPTSSVFTIGTDGAVNVNGNKQIVYCFAEKKGFSKFGSYTGNGNADGTFVYTGFKPALVIMKNSSTATNWHIYDNKRTNNASNPTDDILFANSSSAESTDSSANPIDFLSNGFKCRGTNSASNSSGNTFIYMAFAESPFVTSTGIPATAR